MCPVGNYVFKVNSKNTRARFKVNTDLLEIDNSVSVHHGNIQVLATKLISETGQ